MLGQGCERGVTNEELQKKPEFVQRMDTELKGITEKAELIDTFIEENDIFKGLSKEHQRLLIEQRVFMDCYAATLEARLKLY